MWSYCVAPQPAAVLHLRFVVGDFLSELQFRILQMFVVFSSSFLEPHRVLKVLILEFTSSVGHRDKQK